jgi:hypothetical protein
VTVEEPMTTVLAAPGGYVPRPEAIGGLEEVLEHVGSEKLLVAL